jgi:hypothetical protein
MLDSDPQGRRRLGTLYWKLSSSGGYFHPPATHHRSQVCRSHRGSTPPAILEGHPGEYDRQPHRQFETSVHSTRRSDACVAKKSTVAAACDARTRAGVHREITFSPPPYSSCSPVVWDGECHCGTRGLFPACRLGWHRFSGVKIGV